PPRPRAGSSSTVPGELRETAFARARRRVGRAKKRAKCRERPARFAARLAHATALAKQQCEVVACDRDVEVAWPEKPQMDRERSSIKGLRDLRSPLHLPNAREPREVHAHFVAARAERATEVRDGALVEACRFTEAVPPLDDRGECRDVRRHQVVAQSEGAR